MKRTHRQQEDNDDDEEGDDDDVAARNEEDADADDDDVEMNDDDDEEDNEEEGEDEDDSDNDEDFKEMNLNADDEEEEEHEDDEQRRSSSRTERVTTGSTGITNGSNAFLDSFYGISSADVRERTMAAQVLIQHCLLPPSTLKSSSSSPTTEAAQTKDAAYALRRLMNGLCSGRAAARQGNAATLASFMKVAIALGRMSLLRQEWCSKDPLTHDAITTTSSSDLAFVRHALLSVTEPNVSKPNTAKSQGGRQPTTPTSEERDYKLGRLFGITAILRSGILPQLLSVPQHPPKPSITTITTTHNDIATDIMHIVHDLIHLYQYKKWIREAVAHAICSLLDALHHDTALLRRVIEEAIVPKLLLRGDTHRTTTTSNSTAPTASFTEVISSYSPEQWAMAIRIQSIVGTTLFPLQSTVLCTETVPLLSVALCSTASTVAQPRTHFVWEMILDAISEPISDITATSTSTSTSTNNTSINQRRLKGSLPLLPEGDSVNDLVGAIVQSVIVEGLMGISVSSTNDSSHKVISKSSGHKATQDKYALALTLIRNFLSVPFISSITTNQTMVKLVLTTEQIESMILTPSIVQHLFLNVIGTTSGGKAKPHHNSSSNNNIKILATEVLDQMVRTLLEDTRTMMTMTTTTTGTDMHSTNTEESVLFDDMIRKRVAIALVLLRRDARFDAKTKTPTVERLLGLTAVSAANTEDDNAVPDDTIITDKNDVILKSIWKPYMTFLEQQIIGDPSSTSNVRSHYEIQGYVDLLYQFGKFLSRNTAPIDTDSIQRIYGFLMTVAFFNCSNMETTESTEMVTKKKKKNKRQSISSQNQIIIDIARMIQESRSKLNDSPTLPFEVRSVASARFFSLVTDTITTIIHSSSPDKEMSIITFLSNLNTMISHLIGSGAKKIVTITPSDDMDTDADIPPELVVKKMMEDAQTVSESGNKDATARWKNGCAILGSTLYLHLFSCGHADIGNIENVDPNADDDEDYEETIGLLYDLRDIATAFANTGGTSQDAPLQALAELCARILSSPLGVGNQSRGASPTLLRDTVKMAWTGGLTLSASFGQDDDVSALDKETINVLLNALGAIDDTMIDENEDDDDEDGSDDDDDESEDELSTPHELKFPSITDIDLEDNIMKVDDDNDDDEESDEELQIDPEKLKTLLEEESDADVDEGELEHHEGADAALAKLIQLKQEARKAGTLAKERAEIARQIRCIILLETLVVGKEGNWGSLLRVDHVMHMILPILKYRSEIVKSLVKSISKGSNPGSNEKAALLSKLTALLKNKILKAKIADMEWTESIDVSDTSTAFVNAIMKQALDSDDKEQRSLCNSCIIYVLRCIEDSSTKLQCASVYSDAVAQWSTKRTTRLDSAFFEGLLHQSPVLAQACLTEALATAAMNGRTTYLKSEAFRLLSMLYNPKLNTGASEFDRVALARLTDSTANVLASIISSLQDMEMKKTKRIRDVLKAAEKVIRFLSVSSTCPPNCIVGLQDMTKLLQVIKDDSESHGIVNSITNLISNMDGVVSKGSGEKKQIRTNDPSKPTDNDEDDPVDDMDLEKEATNMNKDKSKKKKNKSKKKKK